jgi:hypothetical protein
MLIGEDIDMLFLLGSPVHVVILELTVGVNGVLETVNAK